MQSSCLSRESILLALAPALFLATADNAHARRAGDIVPDSFICVFKPGPLNVGNEARTSVASAGGRVKFLYRVGFNGFAAEMTQIAMTRMLQKNPLIDYCDPDRLASVPDGEAAATPVGRPGGGGGGGSTQVTAWGVTRVGGPGDGTGKTAWVIDSGIQLNHPDLVVDPARSYCFLSPCDAAGAGDEFGHGTHVAGIIGARNNTIGVVGVAAGATVVSLRVLDATGSGPDSGVIAAINWVCDSNNRGQAGDVVNLSLITVPTPTMDTAIETCAMNKGIMFAIAAGNNSAFAGNYSPAEAVGTNVFTVSATDSRDAYASYSNWGEPPIVYAEPGSSILSTYLNSGYATLSGTSMAAPHIAGILLLHGLGGNGVAVPPANGGLAKRPPNGQAYVIGVR